MSTPADPNDPNPRVPPEWITPGQTEVRGSSGTGRFGTTKVNLEDDEAAKRRAANTTAIIGAQVQGTDALLNTLLARMNALTDSVQGLPNAFASTADHIKRSADATEHLARSSKRVADQQERGRKEVDKTKFSVIDIVKHLASGNLGGAIGEAFQGIPGFTGVRKKLSQRADDIRQGIGEGTFRERIAGKGEIPVYGPVTKEQDERGKENLGTMARDEAVARSKPGTMAALTRGAAMRGMAAAAGIELAGGLFTPAAIFGAYKVAQQVNQAQREALQTGQLTGEGRMAGLAAGGVNIPIFGRIGGEAGALRGSPFDLVGSREAMEIVQGVRGAGFRGEDARSTEESIAGMVNDLGIGVQDAMNIAIPAIRDAGMSVGELSAQMNTLDESAKESGSGIASLQKAIADLLPALSMQSRHVAQQAIGAIEDFQHEFAGLSVARHPERFGGLFGPGKARETLAQLSGFSPFQAYDPAFADNFKSFFNKQLLQIGMMNWDQQGKHPLMNWTAFVHRVVLPNPLYAQMFEGFSADDIADMLRRAINRSAGGTRPDQFIQRQANENRARNAAREAQAITENFRTTMQAKQSSFHGLLTRDLFGNSGGVDRSLIEKRGQQAENRLEKVISNLGLSDQVRNEILDPLRKGIKDRDRGEVTRALDAANERIKDAQAGGDIHVRVTTGFDPRSARILKTLDVGTIAAQRGMRGTQGTTPQP